MEVHERGAGVAGLILMLATLALAGLAPGADAGAPDSRRINAFLAGIDGQWQGQAVITPIGPRPYDIDFARNAAGEVEGAAYPGDAIHIWTFYRQGERLRLRFLSTFRGNRQPIFLTASGEVGGTLIFHALQPDFLEIRIEAEPQALAIRVLHHQRLHVEIRLQRR